MRYEHSSCELHDILTLNVSTRSRLHVTDIGGIVVYIQGIEELPI